MATVQGFQDIREAYTFDDVLLKPGLSDVLPSEVDIHSRVTRRALTHTRAARDRGSSRFHADADSRVPHRGGSLRAR